MATKRVPKDMQRGNIRLLSTDSTDNPKLYAKTLSDGRESLYLEFYFGYRKVYDEGKDTEVVKHDRRKEFLHRYLWQAPRTPLEKQHNKDTLELAKKKRRVFVTQPTTPYEVGDLWVQGETGDILKCSTSRATGNYNSADWGKASKYTDDSALNTFKTNTYATDKENMLGLIDGKIESYFQTSDPAESWNTDALKNEHLGDTWFDSSKNALKFYKTKGVSDISSLLGSTFHIWKKSAAPTLSNAPASSWTNTALKNEHLSDVYYSTSNRKLYFFYR